MDRSEAIERVSLLMKYSAKSGVYTSQAQKAILKNFTLEEQFWIIAEVVKANGPLFAPAVARERITEQVHELEQELKPVQR